MTAVKCRNDDAKRTGTIGEGVGEFKYKKYGEKFLQCIAENSRGGSRL